MGYQRSAGYVYVKEAFLVAAVGLAIAACGGDDGPAGSGGQAGGAGGPEGGLGEQYADAYCGKIAECCDYDALGDSFETAGIRTYAGCRIAYRTSWEAYLEHLLEQSSKAGRLAFDEASFTSCMAAVKGMSCADFGEARGADVPACMAMFVPKVALGGACTNSIECVEGKCEVPDDAAEGTCFKLPGEGEPCLDGSCGEGVRCENQVCVPYLADGAACDSNNDCQSSACKKADPASPMGTCVRICDGGGPGVGPVNAELEALGPALVSAMCEKMSSCCTVEETAEFLFSSSIDETKCRGLYSALYGSFALPLLNTYEVEGKVEIDGAGMLACVEAFNARSCEEHSKSTSLEPVCLENIKPKVPDGGACSESLVCVSGNCVEPSGSTEDGACQPMPGPGAPCDDECIEGHYCDAGACIPQVPLGATCSFNDSCAAGTCYDDPASGERTCAYICDGK
jgi:hypothetical protein